MRDRLPWGKGNFAIELDRIDLRSLMAPRSEKCGREHLFKTADAARSRQIERMSLWVSIVTNVLKGYAIMGVLYV